MHRRRIGSSTCHRPKQIEGFGPRSSPALDLSVAPSFSSLEIREFSFIWHRDVKWLKMIGNLCEFAWYMQTHFIYINSIYKNICIRHRTPKTYRKDMCIFHSISIKKQFCKTAACAATNCIVYSFEIWNRKEKKSEFP